MTDGAVLMTTEIRKLPIFDGVLHAATRNVPWTVQSAEVLFIQSIKGNTCIGE